MQLSGKYAILGFDGCGMTGEGSERIVATGRPISVVWYERLALAALVIGLASSALDPATFFKYYERYSVVYLIMFVCSVAGQLLWIWLIARKRQNWASWISLVVVIIGLPNFIWDFEERFRLNAAAAIVYHAGAALLMVAVFLLFRHDAREWFGRKRLAFADTTN
jgi:hypothetical protein